MVPNQKPWRLRAFAIAAGLATLLAGCTTTTTTSLWKNPDLGDVRFDSILVMGVADDPFARRKYEDALAGALRDRGVRAASSYSRLPGEGKPSQEDVDDAIRRGGFQAVLVTHVVAVDEESVYHPGYYEYYSRPVYDHYYRYYAYTYDRIYRPGYVATYTTVSLETSLYQAPSGRIAWGMRTKSIDPEQLDRLIRDLVEETVGNLARSGLVAGGG